MGQPTARQTREELAARLRESQEEFNQAALDRSNAIAGLSDDADPTYVEGLRQAVAAAVEFGIASVELDRDETPPTPSILLCQARLAAAQDVPMDTVLRRYFAGFALFTNYLTQAADACKVSPVLLQRLLAAQATQFDLVLAAVSEEYKRARERRFVSVKRRLVEDVQRTLDGDPGAVAALEYDFSGWHRGLIATGEGAAASMRDLAGVLDCRLLVVGPEDGVTWAWMRLREEAVDEDEAKRLANWPWPVQLTVGIGEPAPGVKGWRLSHRQAAAALAVAGRLGESSARYSEIALFATVMRDDLLAASLRQLYLAPLDEGRNGGEIARATLHAYFATDRQVSSAAAMLGVKRHTVTRRLREIERKLGRPLSGCAAELEIGLRLDSLVDP